MIFDEKAYAEELNNKGFSNGKVNRKDVFIYAKWLKYLGKKPKQINEDIIAFCTRNDDGFNKIIHSAIIKDAMREIKKHMLRVHCSIYITQKELDRIRKLDNIKYEKVLFSVLVAGKYFRLNPIKILTKNQIQDMKDGDEKICFYYNSDIKEAIRLAKVVMSKKERIEMEHCFVRDGFLENTAFGTLKIPFVDVSEEFAINVERYNNLSLYYENYFGTKDVTYCDECGDLIWKRNGATKYCTECKKEKRKETWNKSQKKRRGVNTQK